MNDNWELFELVLLLPAQEEPQAQGKERSLSWLKKLLWLRGQVKAKSESNK